MPAPRSHLSTAQVARAVGVHPNTIRLYEAWGFLPPVPRSPSNYRRFGESHVRHARLARTILRFPYPGGKAPVLELVRRAAAGDLGGALELAYTYLGRIRAERAQSEAGLRFLERWAEGVASDATAESLRIGEVARLLQVTPDALRNWERNGLIEVPRHPVSGYRVYSAAEIGRLRVIRILRRCGYSMMALLRTLNHLDGGGREAARVLDTPAEDEDIYSVADRWISTLAQQEQRALEAISLLEEMIARPNA